MGVVGAGGDAPVHGADVISGLVFAHFGKVDTPPTQRRAVDPGLIVEDLLLFVQR